MTDIAEPRTYADVVTAHAPALLRLAVMLTGSAADAEDLLQASLLRAARHGDRVAAMTAPAAYLRKVLLNEHHSHGRRLSRRVRTVSSEDVTAEPVAPAGVDTVDLRDEAWRWLATLRPRQRAVLVLRYYEDLPDAEIAGLLGCAETTVRSHAFRGLAALRARLAEEET
ncbi:SigE family RNA polymerase sigma factor [Nocardioides hungaricus]